MSRRTGKPKPKKFNKTVRQMRKGGAGLRVAGKPKQRKKIKPPERKDIRQAPETTKPVPLTETEITVNVPPKPVTRWP